MCIFLMALSNYIKIYIYIYGERDVVGNMINLSPILDSALCGAKRMSFSLSSL